MKKVEICYLMISTYRFSMSPYREQDWLVNYPLYSILAVMEKR